MNPSPMHWGFVPKLTSLYCHNLCRHWAQAILHYRLETPQ